MDSIYPEDASGIIVYHNGDWSDVRLSMVGTAAKKYRLHPESHMIVDEIVDPIEIEVPFTLIRKLYLTAKRQELISELELMTDDDLERYLNG